MWWLEVCCNYLHLHLPVKLEQIAVQLTQYKRKYSVATTRTRARAVLYGLYYVALQRSVYRNIKIS